MVARARAFSIKGRCHLSLSPAGAPTRAAPRPRLARIYTAGWRRAGVAGGRARRPAPPLSDRANLNGWRRPGRRRSVDTDAGAGRPLGLALRGGVLHRLRVRLLGVGLGPVLLRIALSPASLLAAGAGAWRAALRLPRRGGRQGRGRCAGERSRVLHREGPGGRSRSRCRR